MAGQKVDFSSFEDPHLDEGWWDSVMAEEVRHPAQRPQPAPRPHAVDVAPESGEAVTTPAREPRPHIAVGPHDWARNPPPDWERAHRIFEDDQIIALTVRGHNRGGLLVETEGLRGFVPFSHLVGMTNLSDGDERDQFLAAYEGRELRLKIIECAPAEDRIVFSERAARADAGCRNRLFNELKPGDQINGEVTNITDFGMFVDLGGVEGLVHISELSWGRVAHPSQIGAVGQRLDVLVLEVSPDRCRVALSLKRLQPNPWEEAAVRYPINSVTAAEITALSSYGAFARLAEGMEGLIHASQIPLPEGTTVREYLSVGQQVDVRIIQLDASRQRLGLSLDLTA